VVHARKESDEAFIVGFIERVDGVRKHVAKLVVWTREEGSAMNGYDVTTR
jgi:hypothetical protein